MPVTQQFNSENKILLISINGDFNFSKHNTYTSR